MTEYTSRKIRAISLLAIIMIVVIHGYNLSERRLESYVMVTTGLTWNAYIQLLFSNGIARFASPLFFLISGYLNYPTQSVGYRSYMLRRLRTLFVPYVFWSAVGLLIFWSAEHYAFLWDVMRNNQIGLYPTVKVGDYTAQQLFEKLIVNPIPFQLWFLRSLLCFCLVAPLIVYCMHLSKVLLWCAVLILGTLWYFAVNFYYVEGDGLLFFTLGLWLRHGKVDVETAPRWFNLRLFAAGGLSILLFKTWLAFGPNDAYGPMIETLLYRLSQLIGVLVVWFGYDAVMRGRLPGPRWIAFSNLTFIIYALHVPLLNLVTNSALMILGPSELAHFSVYIVSISAVIGLCMASGTLLWRVSPLMFAIATGGRGMFESAGQTVANSAPREVVQ